MDASDPFAPLGAGEAAVSRPIEPDDFEPLPIPDGCEPPAAHSKLGRWTMRWPYCGAAAELQGYVVRFDTPEGKETRPLRYGRIRGREGWHYKGWADGRPLYRLPQLLAADPITPVLVVEGEKAADAAALLLPEMAAVTSMNGARSAAKTDWRPVADRDVVIWPDNDEAGDGYAREVAAQVKAAGGFPRIVALPDGASEGWDLADPMPEGWNPDLIRAAITASQAYDPSCVVQRTFMVRFRGDGQEAPGLYHEVQVKDSETGEVTTKWVWFASRLDVVADTRDAMGEQWGRLLEVHDRDGSIHQWAMPMEMMAGSGEEYRRELLRLGMVLRSGGSSRALLADYLSTWRTRAKARCVDRIGWHGTAFVLPDRTYGGGERLILQLVGAAPEMTVAGDLRSWQREIAAYAVGNSRLVLGICAALAGPLVYLAGEESGGFHLCGASSIGKTVTLHAARSVTGSPLASWRTTDNAAEALARGACDSLAALDEIGQAPAHVVDALSYMLGNGRGKARMRRDASARAPMVWRVLFLSTGELGLTAKLTEGGRRPMAGQMVRVIEIPADAGKGMGVFERLHGFASPAALAEHLRLATDRHHGHALRAFLGKLVGDLGTATELVREVRDAFIEEHCPADADGQVRRAAGRFALLAAAGEMARCYGVVPWPEQEAEAAAARCFADWVKARGGSGAAEVTSALRQVRLFIEQHGSARFEPAWLRTDEGYNSASDATATTILKTVSRAGFRRTDDAGNWTYYVLPEVWAAELCKGFDPRMVAMAMVERSWLVKGDGRNLTQAIRVPNNGKLRLYVIGPSFLAEGVA